MCPLCPLSSDEDAAEEEEDDAVVAPPLPPLPPVAVVGSGGGGKGPVWWVEREEEECVEWVEFPPPPPPPRCEPEWDFFMRRDGEREAMTSWSLLALSVVSSTWLCLFFVFLGGLVGGSVDDLSVF